MGNVLKVATSCAEDLRDPNKSMVAGCTDRDHREAVGDDNNGRKSTGETPRHDSTTPMAGAKSGFLRGTPSKGNSPRRPGSVSVDDDGKTTDGGVVSRVVSWFKRVLKQSPSESNGEGRVLNATEGDLNEANKGCDREEKVTGQAGFIKPMTTDAEELDLFFEGAGSEGTNAPRKGMLDLSGMVGTVNENSVSDDNTIPGAAPVGGNATDKSGGKAKWGKVRSWVHKRKNSMSNLHSGSGNGTTPTNQNEQLAEKVRGLHSVLPGISPKNHPSLSTEDAATMKSNLVAGKKMGLLQRRNSLAALLPSPTGSGPDLSTSPTSASGAPAVGAIAGPGGRRLTRGPSQSMLNLAQLQVQSGVVNLDMLPHSPTAEGDSPLNASNGGHKSSATMLDDARHRSNHALAAGERVAQPSQYSFIDYEPLIINIDPDFIHDAPSTNLCHKISTTLCNVGIPSDGSRKLALTAQSSMWPETLRFQRNTGPMSPGTRNRTAANEKAVEQFFRRAFGRRVGDVHTKDGDYAVIIIRAEDNLSLKSVIKTDFVVLVSHATREDRGRKPFSIVGPTEKAEHAIQCGKRTEPRRKPTSSGKGMLGRRGSFSSGGGRAQGSPASVNSGGSRGIVAADYDAVARILEDGERRAVNRHGPTYDPYAAAETHPRNQVPLSPASKRHQASLAMLERHKDDF